jgi:hypothetical protein
MTNPSKKYGFLPPLPRRFTANGQDAWALINFRAIEEAADEADAFERPENWSAEATALFAGHAAFTNASETIKAVEENTVPSWLWRRTGEGEKGAAETSVKHVFDRVVGAATYAGWQASLFANEADALDFFDEARYALAQRFIAIDLTALATFGLDWAYGQQAEKRRDEVPVSAVLEISNAAIDSVVSGRTDKDVRTQWQRVTPSAKTQIVTARFSDIASDWGTSSAQGLKALIDLTALRQEEGSVDIEALRHVTRILVILSDLFGAGENLEIGFCNLAPLLMSLALPYDSAGARAQAAALAAVITAEAYATSAELAALRGTSEGFAASRETILRSLRNRRRAAYGERNDYEKISVLPAPLVLADCPDLALAAAARGRWDEALGLAQIHGLRAIQVTSLFSSPAWALFMECTTQGVEPLSALRITRAESADVFRREVHPAVTAALARLGYSAAEKDTIIHHIGGHGTLEKAPGIGHTALRAKKFDPAAIKRVEDYLPYVDDIRLAVTPWIVGEEFCRMALKIPTAKLESPGFDLLRHLGFSVENIAAANAFCYGHGTACNVNTLRIKHIAIFARGDEILPEARIRMAAAVQSFISGEIKLALALPAGTPAEKSEKLLLTAWLQGLKGLTLEHVPSEKPAIAAGKPKRAPVSPFLHAKKPALPARKSQPKVASSIVELAKVRPLSGEGKRR